jgi:catechol 2,3-dioxygenase-like lactoylglutathione lyase family enzyme
VGVELIAKNGRWAYRFDNAQLNLHGPGVEATPLAKIPVPPGGSDLCFEWSGPVEDAVQHLKTCAVAIELGPVHRFGTRGPGISVYFRDPDGSLLEFISYDK